MEARLTYCRINVQQGIEGFELVRVILRAVPLHRRDSTWSRDGMASGSARRTCLGHPRLRASPRLTVEDESRRFEVGGRRPVDLSRRGPIRRILVALVEAHQAGRALDVTEVVSAGWPGEIVPPDAGATRVYTAIRTLRRLGLEGVLLTRDSGYLLDPRTVLHAA